LAQHSGVTLSTVHTMKGQEFDIVSTTSVMHGILLGYLTSYSVV
jgi:superfamily I DNA/RNA helicase